MTSASEEKIVTNREFVAMIRAGLKLAGHLDIPIDRSWIEESSEDGSLLINVPVGPELVVPLMPLGNRLNGRTTDLEKHVLHFVQALAVLHRAESQLIRYVGGLRAAAASAIASAQKRGLDLRLDGVGLMPTYAYHLASDRTQEAVTQIPAMLEIRRTSSDLLPEIDKIWVDDPDEVIRVVREVEDEQRERQSRLAELDSCGADLEVDGLTIDLLAAHGLDAVDVLRRVRRAQCLNIEVQHLGYTVRLSLVSEGGRVKSGVHLPDAYWNGEHLWFLEPELFTGHRGLVGACLGDRIRHPVLASRPVVDVVDHPAGRELVFFDMGAERLFDAETGRIWPREDPAA